MVPLGVLPYVVAGFVAVGALTGAYFKGRAAGAESRNAEIVALQSDIERSRLAALAAEKRAEEAAKNVRIEYRTKVETIIQEREAARELIEVVRRDASCDLPPAYRELWDGPRSSAADQGSARVDGAPVSMADAAEAAAEARARFEKNAAKLAALQNYIAQIQDAPPSPDYRP